MKTHCRNGHPLSGDNLRINSRGNRVCRTCDRAARARWRANHPRPGLSNALKTHCPAGHPYDEENTMWTCGGTKRICRTCHRERVRRARKR